MSDVIVAIAILAVIVAVLVAAGDWAGKGSNVRVAFVLVLSFLLTTVVGFIIVALTVSVTQRRRRRAIPTGLVEVGPSA